ncbi:MULTISPECIES: GNAT family N-acetyltransferase [unclassified Mycobacterium]|uniref:GNAT family N-acetyltransferase n=1 Tax=unclassified Mycobacterium TaxID=2642494 RepID=UPI0029C64E6D|nr:MULTISPECIES: GNAT family N-acetyltransferase [unclassified Mycobacterium]
MESSDIAIWPQSGRPSVTFRVRALTRQDAASIAGWRYDGRWASYDLASIDAIVDELEMYSAIVDADGVLHGFFCVDAAARVPGLEPDARFLDVGIGLDPALVGKGWGSELGRVVKQHLHEVHPTLGLRAAVQSWNERSLKVARRLGFSEVCRHSSRGIEYTVLVVSP